MKYSFVPNAYLSDNFKDTLEKALEIVDCLLKQMSVLFVIGKASGTDSYKALYSCMNNTYSYAEL
jgi:hypothetical protein